MLCIAGVGDGDTALVMQLLVKELTIEAILAYQLLMCPRFYKSPCIDHEYLVYIPDGADAMTDSDHDLIAIAVF